MKVGDKCTYITRAGAELPARVISVNQDGTVTIEAQRGSDGVWLQLSPMDVVNEEEVFAARDTADKKSTLKEKDAALKRVRGKVHQKSKDKDKDKEAKENKK